MQFNSLEDIWKLCDRGSSKQCKLVIKAALINIFNIVWLARNNARFNIKLTNWKSAVNQIVSNVSNSSMSDLVLLKAFKVANHPPRAPTINEIIWKPPLINWIKCNSDGAVVGSPGLLACGGIFRDSQARFISCFAEGLGISNSIILEVTGP